MLSSAIGCSLPATGRFLHELTIFDRYDLISFLWLTVVFITFNNNALTFRKSINSDAQYVTYCVTLQFILHNTLALTQ